MAGKLSRVAGMEIGWVFRLLATLFRPLVVLYRWWRPNTDRMSIAVLADRLAGQVKREEERLRRELRAGASSLAHVEFRAAPQPHRPGEVLDSATVKEIGDYFDLLERPHRRRLVVLGVPGSGKTVAATYLVSRLLALRWDLADARRAEEPVPVRVNAAGWDGGHDFSRWLATRLGYDYSLRPNAARKMVDRGLVLPVIDGLDEMDTHDGAGSRARALLGLLNRGLWRDRPVVVLCRTDEFEYLMRLGEDHGLHGATTVTLQPLLSNQITEYLTTYRHDIGTTHSDWTDLTTHIRDHPDGPLATALQTPWLLGLTATTLRHTPTVAGRLIDCPDTDAVRDLLFAVQIPAAVAATDDIEEYRDYTSDNVEKWLRSLARCLQHRRDTGRDGTAIRLDEIWEIADITRVRVLHGLAVGMAATLMFELAVGLTLGRTDAPALALVLGSMAGYAAGSASFPEANHMAWRVPARSRWWRGLTTGIVTGVGTVLSIGAWVLVGAIPVAALAPALVAGFTLGPVVGMSVGLSADTEDQLALAVDERRLIREDIQAAAFIGVLLVPAASLVGGLTFEVAEGFTAEFAVVLTLGLSFGAAAGLTTGLVVGLAAGRFYIAVLVFRFTRQFSKRPLVFLDWARRSGLLRINGTAYQFRHETYRQWIQHTRPAPDHTPSPTDTA